MRSSRPLSALGGLLLLLCTACDDPAVLRWHYLDGPGTPRERRGDMLQELQEPVRLRGDVVETRSVKLQHISCFKEPCPPPLKTTSTWHLEQPEGSRQRILLGPGADAAQQLKKGQRCLLTGVLLYPKQPSPGLDGTVTDWHLGLTVLTLNHWRVEECETPRRGLWR
jgi:hypothetical protein